MRRSLEQALDRAEDVIENAQQRPPKRKYSSSGEKSLHQKLYDIFVEECQKEPEGTEELRSNVNLLEKLVERESLPCLVVNLYPENKGYSLMLEDKTGFFSETIQLPYGERELLEYLDAEELPPILLDVLEKSELNIFHCGCVIAEIRDYRQCSDMERSTYQSRHILLRPTMQTLACDIESMTSDDLQWTQEDKLALESELLLATAEPLCLDPSVTVTCTANRLLYNKQKMNTNPMKRCLKRHSLSSLNLQQELSQHQSPPELRLLTTCKKKREREAGLQHDLRMPAAGYCVDTWRERCCDLAIPSQVDVEKYAKAKEPVGLDDPQATIWPTPGLDDSGFESEGGSQLWEMKLSFMQSLNDPFFSGKTGPCQEARCEIQMYPPLVSPDVHADGFMARSKTDGGAVNVRQELVQSKVKCAGKVPHGSSGSARPSQPSPGKKPKQPTARWVRPSVPGKAMKPRALPVTLPPSTGQTLSGNSPPAQQASSLHKFPPRAPAPKPGGLSQKSPMGVSRGNIVLSPATWPPVRTSEGILSTQGPVGSTGLKVINVVGPVQGAQVLMNGSSSMLGHSTSTCVPASMYPNGLLLPRGQLPNAQPCPTQPPAQAGVQLILNNTLGPLTVLQLPPGSLILSPLQQHPQPLQPQPQPLPQPPPQLYQLIPQQQLQQPTTALPPQAGPQASVQGSSGQQWALMAQQAVVINLAQGSSVLQPQSAMLCQLGSGQQTPGQCLPPQRFQLPAAPQGQLQPQPLPQCLQLRLVQYPMSVATAPTLTVQSHGFRYTGGQAKDKMKSSTPKF
ncbi:transcription factor SPT20 homolog [Sciurus carolinensis]|uniref:transcription factor SPT20 homolog n=1 Tax=Sciurus carolinensis TaxID=30640 RepID=UPI001FB32C93|nr:transcription factor SPT20 homolog [Sciurus carolinensis]